MTTIKEMNEDFEEIYLERARYLISVDDLLEQTLSEQILENSTNPTNVNFLADIVLEGVA